MLIFFYFSKKRLHFFLSKAERKAHAQTLHSLRSDDGAISYDVSESSAPVRVAGVLVPRVALNSVLVLITVLSGLGQAAGLPLFVDGVHKAGPYFVLIFASAVFAVIFAAICVPLYFAGRIGKREWSYPQWQLAAIGVFDAFNGILTVYASPQSRTPGFLQAILGNVAIPITFLLTFIVLRRLPGFGQGARKKK